MSLSRMRRATVRVESRCMSAVGLRLLRRRWICLWLVLSLRFDLVCFAGQRSWSPVLVLGRVLRGRRLFLELWKGLRKGLCGLVVDGMMYDCMTDDLCEV